MIPANIPALVTSGRKELLRHGTSGNPASETRSAWINSADERKRDPDYWTRYVLTKWR